MIDFIKNGKDEEEALDLLSYEIKLGNIPVGISSSNNEIRFLKT